MAIRVHELNHVALHVRDLATSVQFYGQVLGLPPLPRPSFDFPGAWFALGSQELHLIVDNHERDDERSVFHIAFRVEDAHAARRELERQGLTEFQGPAPRPDGVLQLFFRDPDGHVIEMLSE